MWRIVSVEGLFKIDIYEFIVKEYGESWVIFFDRFWLFGINIEKMGR